MIHLSKGNIFDKAKTFRDSFGLKRDDNTTSYVQFSNQDFWCQNEFQVSNQITITGKRETRYDVTLLINRLPLVQIELTRDTTGKRITNRIVDFVKTFIDGKKPSSK